MSDDLAGLLSAATAAGEAIEKSRSHIARLIRASDGRPVAVPMPAWFRAGLAVKAAGRRVLRPLRRAVIHSRERRVGLSS